MSARIACSLLAIGAAGCATAPVPGQWNDVREQPLASFETHAACLRMQPGDRLEYAFVARRPVSFEIHYREGKAVVAPVTRDNVTSDGGAFDPLDAHEYCMSWESPPPGTLVDYRYRFLPGGAKR